jgi:MFS family permease
MMKLELFRIRNFSAGSAITLITAFGMFGIFFPLTIFLQGPIGYSPLKAGLTGVPLSIMIMIAAPIAGRLSDRIGSRWLMVAGLTLMSLGIFFLTARTATDTTWKTLILPLVVTGCGMGLTFSPLTTAAMKDVPVGISGSASGIINTVRNVGQVLGIAVLGSVLQNRLAANMSTRLEGAPLPAPVKDHVVTLAGQSRIEEIPVALQNGYQQLIPQVMGDLRLAFVGATQTTFLVSAITCAVAIFVALIIRNPERVGRRVPVPAEAMAESAAQEETSVPVAD